MNREEIKINDLCVSICSGGTPKSTEPLYYEDGTIPWLTTSEVNFKDIYLTQNKITELGYKKSSATIIPINSVIVAMYGVTAGRVAVNKIELTTNQACCNLIIDDKKANYQYVYYYLMMQSKELNRLANGGAQQNLNSIVIKKYKILIPKKIEIQNRISNLLYNYDRLIENNNHRIKLLETMAEELYKEWFVRFKFPGYKKAKFENGIPESWEIKRIKDCSKILVGGDAPSNITDKPSGNNIYPVYSNGIDKDGLYGYTDKYRIDKLSITISARGTIGHTCLRKANYTPIVRLVVLIPNNDINTYYCYQALKYVDLSGNGTSQQQLTIPMIEKRKILIPNILLMNKYGNICKCLYNEIDMLKIKNEILTEQRDYLLPRLMSGKLSVENKNII